MTPTNFSLECGHSNFKQDYSELPDKISVLVIYKRFLGFLLVPWLCRGVSLCGDRKAYRRSDFLNGKVRFVTLHLQEPNRAISSNELTFFDEKV